MTQPTLTVESVRERLQGLEGPRYWRSLEELAQTEEFQDLLSREFQEQLPAEGSGLSRRRFLQLMGASLALAGLNACTIQPDESILPYTKQPEELIPGKPLWFASSLPQADGSGLGVLVENHMGRPTKIEGNPGHPASLGATGVAAQAAVLELYDPDRAQAPHHLGRIRSWNAFEAALDDILTAQAQQQGAGLRILSHASTSPTLARQRAAILERFPRAGWVTYEPAGDHHTAAAARAAFGRDVRVSYHLTDAKILLLLESDLLTEGPDAIRLAREYADGRRVVDDVPMSRAYAVESSPTATSTSVDHRFALPPHEVAGFAAAVAAALGVPGATAPAAFRSGDAKRRVDAVAGDLLANRGQSVVAVGDAAPADVHVLAHAMNERLGNLGRTVRLHGPVAIDPGDHTAAITSLVGEMRAGQVDFLLILGGNPVYDAPADLEFVEALQQVPFRAHVAYHDDETSEYCQWHLPRTHPLESWADLRGPDGTLGIVQPLIHPLYDTRTDHQILELLLESPTRDAKEIVRQTWESTPEKEWRRWLHDGVAGSSATPITASVDAGAVRRAAAAASSASDPGFQLLFRPDPTVGDGRHANNAWLQECPKPLTKLTWDNALLLSPRTAEELDVVNEDLVQVEVDGRTLEVAAWILPGHADGCATLHLGYGRTRGGQVALGCGFNAYTLRSSTRPWQAPASLQRTGERYVLACTQDHHSMEGRALIQSASVEHYHEHPDFAHHGHHVDTSKSLMPGFDYSEGYKWGLTVDLTACVGCNACVVACQSENNIPVVGKDEVRRGREMHWIRVDRYFEGDLDHAEALNQPVMCMHCEQAPCEVVCPVSATVHSDEGLNDMVYNRCVGTRYCSNNCPYKVRRFNYYHYSGRNTTEQLKLQRNPDVTVRSRGVMEKCTYCVQRINHARIEAEVKDLPLGDGQVRTACQQACPSQAIAFGDLNDADSQIAQWQGSPLSYGLLEELGTRPRTTYLARIRNPHPDLEAHHVG